MTATGDGMTTILWRNDCQCHCGWDLPPLEMEWDGYNDHWVIATEDRMTAIGDGMTTIGGGMSQVFHIATTTRSLTLYVKYQFSGRKGFGVLLVEACIF